MITNLIRTSLLLFFLIGSNFGIGQESSSIQSFAISPRAGIYGSSFKKHPIEGALVGIEANVELKRVLFAADYYYFNEMSFLVQVKN